MAHTVSLDYQNMGAFFGPANRGADIQDIYTKAHPMARLFYHSYLTGGGLAGIEEVSKFADAIRNPNVNSKAKAKVYGGTFFYEQRVEHLAVGGTINGSGAQAISSSPQDRHIVARWDLNRKYDEVAIAEDEWQATKSGDKANEILAQVNLIERELAGATKTIVAEIASDLFSTNTSEENGILGLSTGIGPSASDTTTYGSISRSSYTAWRGNYGTASLADMASPLSSDFIPTKWASIIDTLTDNGAMEDNIVIVCGTGMFQKYRKVLQGLPNEASVSPTTAHRYNDSNGRKIPYANLYFNGIPVIRDPDQTSGTAYFLDMDTTYMIGLNNSLFKAHDWQVSENWTQRFARMRHYSNVIVTHPRRNYNLVAS